MLPKSSDSFLRPPSLRDVDALGVIVRCKAADCGYRSWKDLSELPEDLTILDVSRASKCRECGSKGADIDLVQKVWVMSDSPEEWDAVNEPHRRRLQEYIRTHPFRWKRRPD